jgi:thymidylate synthase (FAD)
MPVPDDVSEMEGFVRGRIAVNHNSVLEHAGFSVDFTVNRAISHQLVRHRIASYTMESQRYCAYNKDKFGNKVTFIIPEFIQTYFDANGLKSDSFTVVYDCELEQFNGLYFDNGDSVEIDSLEVLSYLGALADAERSYLNAVKSMPAEVARGLLPNATKTSIVMTCNMAEWRHIFNLRALDKTGKADIQMKEVMVPLLNECKKRFPVFFNDL